MAAVTFPNGGRLSFAPALDEVFEDGQGEGWDFAVYDVGDKIERQDWAADDAAMISAICYYVP